MHTIPSPEQPRERGTARAIEMTPDKVCHSMDELFASKDFERFLRLFNRRKKKEDRHWVNATQDDIKESADLASELYDMWLETIIKGQVAAIADVQELVEGVYESIIATDIERELPMDEVKDRFMEMEINIELVREKCEEYYRDAGYENMLRKIGVLGKKERYSLPMPVVTEGEMQALERAMSDGKMEEIMVEDARITDAELMLGRNGVRAKDIMEKSAPVRAAHFWKARLSAAGRRSPNAALADDVVDKVLELAQEDDTEPRGVRFVAYKGKLRRDNANYYHSFIDQLPTEEHHGMMTLGTFIRAREMQALRGSGAVSDFETFDQKEAGVGSLTHRIHSVLANVTMDGSVLRAEFDRGGRLRIIKIDPYLKEDFYLVRKTVESGVR